MLVNICVRFNKFISKMKIFFGMSEKDSKESGYVKKISKFYQRTGLWKSQTEKEICWIKCTVIVTLLLFGISNGSYMFYLNYDNFDINTEVLLHVVISTHSLFVYLTFIYKQKTMSWLLNILNMKFDHFEDSLFLKKNNFWKNEEENSLFQTNLIYYLTIISELTYLFQTNFYSLDPSSRKLMYPLWFPFPLNNSLYYLVLIFETLIFLIHLNVHIMSGGLIIGCTNLYSVMTNLITNVLTNIHQPQIFKTAKYELNAPCKYQPNENNNHGLEEIQNYLLQQCIEKHILLKKFEKNVTSIYGVIILEVVFISEIFICFSGYQFIQAMEDLDVIRILKSIFTVILLTVELFVYCWFGQKLYTNSMLFTLKIYCCDWYKCSKVFKKSFLIVLLNTSKPVKIGLYGIVHATLSTFLSTLKAAFSYLNLLLILSKDQPA